MISGSSAHSFAAAATPMTTFETPIEIDQSIAIFRNQYRGRSIGDITVRSHCYRYVVTAPVNRKLERLQLSQAIVAL